MKTQNIQKYPIRLPTVSQPIITPSDEINLHAIVISCGKRGSGKSVSVFSKLRDLKEQNLADRIYLISPTKYSNMHLSEGLIDENDIYEEMSNNSVEAILDKIEQDTQDYERYLRQVALYELWKKLEKKKIDVESIDPDLLLEFYDLGIMEMDKTPSWKYPKAKNGIGVFHLVLDDCQSSPLFTPGKGNKFLNMAIRHRHVSSRPTFKVGVSLWILVQNYSTNGGISKALRENCTQLCIFPVKQLDMVEKIASEAGGEVKTNQFLEAYHYATKDSPHDFLLVDFNPKDRGKIFRKKWDEYIVFDKEDNKAS